MSDQQQPAPNDDIMPELVINLQIHIDARASEAQIDQIFAAMRKYLWRRDDNDTDPAPES